MLIRITPTSMTGHDGAIAYSIKLRATPKLIVEISHFLPYLSAKYPPGNCREAKAKN